MNLQLDFFKTEVDVLIDKIIDIERSQDKIRRKLFHQNGALQKKYDDLANEFENLKISMCKEA